MAELKLTAEQEAEAQRLAEIIGRKAQAAALQMARVLVSKKDEELLGATEFEIRERVHKLGAPAIETAVKQRKKGVPRVKHDWSPLPGVGAFCRVSAQGRG